MNQRSELRRDRITGYLVLVIGFAISILMGWHSVRAKSQSSTLGTFVSYWSHPAQSLSLRDATKRIAPRDPVFLMDSSGNCQFAGYVRTASESGDQDLESQNRDVTLCWCLPTVAPESMSWTLYENRGSFSDALHLLLPAEKRVRIEQKVRAAMQQHGAELANQLLPILEDSLKQSLPVMETAVRQSVADHRAELDRLGQNGMRSSYVSV